jgi:hypothetical protein
MKKQRRNQPQLHGMSGRTHPQVIAHGLDNHGPRIEVDTQGKINAGV